MDDRHAPDTGLRDDSSIADPGATSGKSEDTEGGGLQGLGQRIGQWFDKIHDTVISLLLIAIVTVTTLQVVMRYGFNAALPWPEEFARWAFLWMVMLGIASVTRFGGHIRVDVLLQYMGPRMRPVFELVILGLQAVALTLLGYAGVEVMQSTTMTAINLFEIPYSVLYISVPIGAVAALLNLIRVSVPQVNRLWTIAAVGGGVLTAMPVSAYLGVLLEGIDSTLIGVSGLLIFILLGVPIAHSLLLGAYGAFQAGALPEVVIGNHFASAVATNFVLLAIPFFILMGALMNVGGLTRTLIDTAKSFVGHWRGGLGQVNVLTSAMMGGLSGSSSADTATITKTLVPQMERTGYTRDFACAVTASSSLTANLLPPSITLLIYASLASVSVGALFMAGIIPGILLAVSLMIAVTLLARSGRFRVEVSERAGWRARGHALTRAAPALALPLLILMMLRGGAITATEAGAIACVYALVVGFTVYRDLRLSSAWDAVDQTGRDTAVILFLIAASAPLAWMVITEGIPQRVASVFAEQITNPSLLMLGLIGLMVLVGFFLEPPPAMVIIVPVILPVATAVGIDPVHLGVVVVTTVMIGQLTPPVGGLVFITSALADAPVFRVFWSLRWLYPALAVVLLLVALIPGITLLLPRYMGF